MFNKLRKMIEEKMNPMPRQMQQAMRQPALPKAVARQPIAQGYRSMNPQQVSAYNATQPYTQDNVRTNSLVDAGELPESRREGSLRVMANQMSGYGSQRNMLQNAGNSYPQDTMNSSLVQGSPFQVEDDISAGHYFQPVTYRDPQTTAHSSYLQDPRRKLGNY